MEARGVIKTFICNAYEKIRTVLGAVLIKNPHRSKDLPIRTELYYSILSIYYFRFSKFSITSSTFISTLTISFSTQKVLTKIATIIPIKESKILTKQ